jgi:hypothetical protein
VDLTPWHALQEYLATGKTEVTIPYAPVLADSVPPVALRLRRDFRSLLALIRTPRALSDLPTLVTESLRVLAIVVAATAPPEAAEAGRLDATPARRWGATGDPAICGRG